MKKKFKKILISIKPEFADKILNGEKKFEYRTKLPKSDINYLLIYWTFPTMKILAKVKVDYVIKSTPIEMWKETKSFSGISEEKFFKYFKNKKNAYAFKLGKIIKFKKPKKLSDFKISFAPQSFVYINN